MNKCNKCGNDNADNSKYCRECGCELPKPKVEEIQQPVQKSIKKKDYKNLTIGIVGAVCFIASYFLVPQLFKTPKLDKEMMKIASEINKSCPIILDRETQLDNVMVLPPNVLQYQYTLINMEKETTDTMMLKNALEPKITNSVRTNPNMQFQRDKKVTFKYYYKDKDGNYLFTISVTPEQYK